MSYPLKISANELHKSAYVIDVNQYAAPVHPQQSGQSLHTCTLIVVHHPVHYTGNIGVTVCEVTP